MYESIYWVLRDFADNDAGRGIMLGSIAGIIAMPKYYLGALLKKYVPEEISHHIPSILTVFSLFLAGAVLAPFKNAMPNITFTELMLVSGLGTAIAKNVNDTTKLKKERQANIQTQIKTPTSSISIGEKERAATLL
jgi:hypothetical protein